MASLTTLLEGYLASTSMAMGQNIIKNIDAVYMEFICTFYADCLSIYLMLLSKEIP